MPLGGIAGPVVTEGGRCFVVNLIGRLGSIALSLPVVVRVDEQFRQEPCNYYFESVLGSAVTARVLTCPPTVLVALRLRAAVGLGAAPSGMKSLWDLYRLITSGKVDSSLASGAVADAFRDRGVLAPKSAPLLLSEDFAADASRQQVWTAFLKRARVDAPVLSEVVRSVHREAWPWLVQGVLGVVPWGGLLGDRCAGWLSDAWPGGMNFSTQFVLDALFLKFSMLPGWGSVVSPRLNPVDGIEKVA